MVPSISGEVKRDGEPAGGVYVRLVGPSGEFVSEQYTQDDGTFTFHVAEGSWTLEARAAGARTETQTVQIASGKSQSVVAIDLQQAG
jgi:uncharacterized protein YfaS (alpha-2-macroglobulin family)